jgi:hypothetical protein
MMSSLVTGRRVVSQSTSHNFETASSDSCKNGLLVLLLLGVMARGAIVMVAVAMMANSQAMVAYSTTGPTVELEGLVCLGLVVS